MQTNNNTEMSYTITLTRNTIEVVRSHADKAAAKKDLRAINKRFGCKYVKGYYGNYKTGVETRTNF